MLQAEADWDDVKPPIASHDLGIQGLRVVTRRTEWIDF